LEVVNFSKFALQKEQRGAAVLCLFSFIMLNNSTFLNISRRLGKQIVLGHHRTPEYTAYNYAPNGNREKHHQQAYT
jgi:hypothetical protein